MAAFGRSGGFFPKSQVSSEKPAKSWFTRFRSDLSLSDEEAFLAILMAAARADGVVTPEESQELAALTSRTITLAKYSMARVSEMRTAIDEKIEQHGFDSVLGAACFAILNSKKHPELTRQKAESVFAHAVDLVFADRRVNEREQSFLEELALQLNIDHARGAQIVSVIEVKNAF